MSKRPLEDEFIENERLKRRLLDNLRYLSLDENQYGNASSSGVGAGSSNTVYISSIDDFLKENESVDVDPWFLEVPKSVYERPLHYYEKPSTDLIAYDEGSVVYRSLLEWFYLERNGPNVKNGWNDGGSELDMEMEMDELEGQMQMEDGDLMDLD